MADSTVTVTAACEASFDRLYKRLDAAYEKKRIRGFKADREARTFTIDTDDPTEWTIRADIADGDCKR